MALPDGFRRMIDLENNVTNISSQLSDVTNQNNGTQVNPTVNGLVVNDETKATNNATIINSLLTAGKNVVLPSGNIYISDTLVMTEKTSIKGMANTTLIINQDKDVIRVKNKCVLENLNINMFANGTKSGLYISTTDQVRDITCNNIHINGYAPWNASETAIAINVVGDTGYFVYCNFNNIKLENCYKGINIYPTGTAWCTSFNFTNIVIENCKNIIETHSSRGKFDFIVQVHSSTQSFVKVYGNYNEFLGFFYDLQNSSVRPLYTVNSGSTKNIIQDAYGTYNLNDFIADYGAETRITNTIGVNNPIVPTYARTNNGTQVTTYPILQGKQDDALAYMHKRGTVSLLSGTITYGSVTKLFDYNVAQTGTIFDLSTTTASIEIIPPEYMRNVTCLGITGDKLPKKFNIYFKITSGGEYILYKSVDNNINCNYQFRPSYTGLSSCYAIKIDFLEGYGGTAIINKIWADDSCYGGQTFFKAGGGNVYGDVNMTTNYLTVGNIAALPTAGSTYAGKVIRVAGSVGVADKLYICMKSATETYSWVQIAIG